jgi:predicted nucleic acid-binding protein
MANSPGREALRVMVDATVLIAGVAFPRWPFEVLQHALRGDFHLVLSPLVIAPARKHLRRSFPAFAERFERFLTDVGYEEVPDPTPDEVGRNRQLVRDVDDVPVALAAIHAQVDYLISEDKDFTTQDESTAELRACLRPILSGTFLREVMGWNSEELETVRGRRW